MPGLLRFLFKGEIPPLVAIRRLKADRAKEAITPPDEDRKEKYRFLLVAFFSGVLSLVLLICVVAIVVLVVKGKGIPEFLTHIVTGIIGYFGGAIAAYFGFQSA